MKIAQISKADSSGGGASRIAEELCFNINTTTGHMCDHILAFSKSGEFRCHEKSLYGAKERNFILKKHKQIKNKGYPEVFPFELAVFLFRNRIAPYNLFHFHDLSGAISPFTLLMLSFFKPVIWTFHDCSPFTGGCLYPFDCINYKTSCGNCPQIGLWPLDIKKDTTKLLYSLKKLVHKRSSIIPIAPSNWMADIAYSSGMLKEKPKVIYNGVDTQIFKPMQKNSVRDELGLPHDRKIILISSGDIGDKRKGVKQSIEALLEIKDTNPFALLIGTPSPSITELLNNLDHISTGYINTPSIMAKYYASADVFLNCSTADNCPLTVLETMACGVPTIGFSIGGIPELIEHNKSGFLVPSNNTHMLIDGIRTAFTNNNALTWSRNARQRAVDNFSLDSFISNHIELYHSLIKHKTA
mgnify:CR=1 FL=1